MDDMPSDTIDTPVIPETPEVVETPPVSDVSNLPDIPEVMEAPHTSGNPLATDASKPKDTQQKLNDQINSDKPLKPTSTDISMHPQPGGFEGPRGKEPEAIEAPKTPEKPYHGGGPESGY